MPRQLKEIKNFNLGTILNVSEKDIPEDAAAFSLNINPFTYNYVANAIRFFFLGNDYIESYEQNKLSNLNSCNNIFNACLYDMFNFCYSLPQSNELWMDYQILNNSNQTGFFCYSTVYG